MKLSNAKARMSVKRVKKCRCGHLEEGPGSYRVRSEEQNIFICCNVRSDNKFRLATIQAL